MSRSRRIAPPACTAPGPAADAALVLPPPGGDDLPPHPELSGCTVAHHEGRCRLHPELFESCREYQWIGLGRPYPLGGHQLHGQIAQADRLELGTLDAGLTVGDHGTPDAGIQYSAKGGGTGRYGPTVGAGKRPRTERPSGPPPARSAPSAARPPSKTARSGADWGHITDARAPTSGRRRSRRAQPSCRAPTRPGPPGSTAELRQPRAWSGPVAPRRAW
jgi:hypothetical protein